VGLPQARSELNDFSSGSDGPMATALKRYNGGRVLFFVIDAFAKISGDVIRICGIIAHDLARTHVSYCNGDAKCLYDSTKRGNTYENLGSHGNSNRKSIFKKWWQRGSGRLLIATRFEPTPSRLISQLYLADHLHSSFDFPPAGPRW